MDGSSSDGQIVGPEVARAEELVDQLSQTVGTYVSKLGLEIIRRAALAREEAEDMWAEAQSIRRGESQ